MKLWGGRFTKQTSSLMDDFHSSISFDWKLYRYDILGSIAHATMLGEQGIIPTADAEQICSELRQILTDIEENKVVFEKSAEDIHMNIEQLLIARIGDVGKRLHTGRSRNDQVALDIRMYLKDHIRSIQSLLLKLCNVLTDISENNLDTLMPGYTHLQKAQPITLAHHLMAYVQMFLRDTDRYNDCYRRTDIMPLGSGALAGTTYPLDRSRVSELLGFSDITQNSLDGVSDRDFCVEFLSCCSLTMMHLSRFCEELVLWSSNEFGFVEMDDAYSTGSSIMPQKKNPDVAELIRGKTGRVYGNLTTLLTLMKSLPLAYNKDMQEDKPAVFDGAETVLSCLEIFTNMVSTLKFNIKSMFDAAGKGFTNATDAADYMVKKGMPFREAHECIGKLVLYCLQQNKTLEQLSLNEYRQISSIFEDDIYDAISLDTCVNLRACIGGPAQAAVETSIRNARQTIVGFSENL